MGWNGVEFTLPSYSEMEADRRQRYHHAIGDDINYPYAEYIWQFGGKYSNNLTEEEVKTAQEYVSKLIEEYEKIGWGNLCVHRAMKRLEKCKC